MHDPLTSAARPLNAHKPQSGPVIYWMSRDQRTRSNKTLLFAQELALQRKQPLVVVFVKTTVTFAQPVQYDFLFSGLKHVARELAEKNIPFVLLEGEPAQEVAKFALQHLAGSVICDFSPLRVPRAWREELATKLHCALIEVDAHNIVPAWVASPKQEYAARTMRPKLEKVLPLWMKALPELETHPFTYPETLPEPIWPATTKLGSGEKTARLMLTMFLKQGLTLYHERSNNPSLDVQSHLSPFLHFGQIAPLDVALGVQQAAAPAAAKTEFLDQLIIRRELAENYCLYNPHYDSPSGFPDWAQASLSQHEADPRPFLYTLEEFRDSKTHDKLWNAAQTEMVKTGTMPGYLRMYWAKKILEWTPNVAQAHAIAIELNDTYQLDGRDPNGYTGIAWSLGGVHDRAWFDRPIFGQVRYMALSGMKTKFDVKGYIAEVAQL